MIHLLCLGVGRSLQRKLASVGIKTVADLLKHSKDSLQKAVGQKTGQVLFDYARGRDEREVEIPKVLEDICTCCSLICSKQISGA